MSRNPSEITFIAAMIFHAAWLNMITELVIVPDVDEKMVGWSGLQVGTAL